MYSMLFSCFYNVRLLCVLLMMLSLVACTNGPREVVADTTSGVSSASVAAKARPYLERPISEDVFYFVLPDRFYNGDPTNDQGAPSGISHGGFNPASRFGFHGGDISGLQQKLDYIEGLGVTAIWMTPILRNRAVQHDGYAHHGYWVIDFTEIDPHFGSNADLKAFIDAAHERNIKVFFDIITNHTADVIKYRECHQSDGQLLPQTNGRCAFIEDEQYQQGARYKPFVVKGEEAVKVPAWLNDPQYYHNRGDSYWEGSSVIAGDFVGLDDLDTSNPFVVNALTDLFKDLISEFKPDGFRIDTVKHVHLSMWQQFGPAIVAHGQSEGIPNFFIFGEVYDGNPSILSTYTRIGGLPSVLDFGFFFNTKDSILQGGNLQQLAGFIAEADYYNDANTDRTQLLNFTGNHDAGRAAYFTTSALADASATEHLARVKMAHEWMFFSPGVPILYYGDEQGFVGDGGDVNSRQDMFTSQVPEYLDDKLLGSNESVGGENFDVAHPLYQSFQSLSALRQQYPLLQYGEQQLTSATNDVLVMQRFDPSSGERFSVIVNQQPTAFSLPAEIGNVNPVYNVEKTEDRLVVPALSVGLVAHQEPLRQVEPSVITVSQVEYQNQRIHIKPTFDISIDPRHERLSLRLLATDSKNHTRLLAQDHSMPYQFYLHPEELDDVEQLTMVVNGSDIAATLTRDQWQHLLHAR